MLLPRVTCSVQLHKPEQAEPMSKKLEYYTPLLAITMFLALLSVVLMGMLLTKPIPCTTEIPCADGKSCPIPWQCCDTGCCAPGSVSPPRLEHDHFEHSWYTQWPVLFLLGTLGGIVICCIYCLCCKRSPPNSVYMCSLSCCVRRPPSNQDSAGSLYLPPRYSRCGSFHQAPPPYSEVTSKPDLYPLVITCGEGDGKSGGNYLMVQYFRNYVIRAPGSLSATSTAESLNSSFLCNAANEANTIIPPPYSCASNYDDRAGMGCRRSMLRSLSSLAEPRAPPPPRARTAPDVSPAPQPRPRDSTIFRENLITSPAQPFNPSFDLELDMNYCEMYCDGACKPRLGPSPPVTVGRSPSNLDDEVLMANYENEPYGLKHMFRSVPIVPGSRESPPLPTSPTQTYRESTLGRPSDERHRRTEPAKKSPRARKSSLYMPLVVAYPARTSRRSPGARASSRSEPVTPCNPLFPNLLQMPPRVRASRHVLRSSRAEEESTPLLSDIEQMKPDHKF